VRGYWEGYDCRGSRERNNCYRVLHRLGTGRRRRAIGLHQEKQYCFQGGPKSKECGIKPILIVLEAMGMLFKMQSVVIGQNGQKGV